MDGLGIFLADYGVLLAVPDRGRALPRRGASRAFSVPAACQEQISTSLALDPAFSCSPAIMANLALCRLS
jgi:hypothetical protein